MKISSILFAVSIIAPICVYAGKNDCAPNQTSKDKITKESFEIWSEKLASSSSFKSATNGKSDFLYYIYFYKSSNGNKGIGINISQTSPYAKELFGEDVKFNKGDKLLFGWEVGEPLELVISKTESKRNVYTGTQTVVNSYNLVTVINDEDIQKLKDYFLNDHIIGLRIISNSDNVIETEVNDKKNTKISAKAKCFFDSL